VRETSNQVTIPFSPIYLTVFFKENVGKEAKILGKQNEKLLRKHLLIFL